MKTIRMKFQLDNTPSITYWEEKEVANNFNAREYYEEMIKFFNKTAKQRNDGESTRTIIEIVDPSLRVTFAQQLAVERLVIRRMFYLECYKCKKKTPHKRDTKSSTQRIQTYPRRGTCTKCGDTIFNASISARVQKK